MLEKNPNTLKIVYKAYPLPSHKMSMPAVQAAFAANKQGRFWDFYDKLYSDFRNLSPEKIKQIATDLKLDLGQYEKDLADRQLQALVSRDLREAQKAGVGGTPTMYINGLLVQNRSPQGIQEMIDRELRKRGPAK
ncbi:MAG: thioredoxin domain-containing protein [Desulfobulbaceae bacterium]|nr:thioredoxin domain-containing protein [Desulfobulbaceae bacterium]